MTKFTMIGFVNLILWIGGSVLIGYGTSVGVGIGVAMLSLFLKGKEEA